MKVSIDYNWLGKVENEIRSSHYALKEIQYTDGVEVFVHVLKDDVESFTNWLIEVTNGQAKIESIETLFIEFLIDSD